MRSTMKRHGLAGAGLVCRALVLLLAAVPHVASKPVAAQTDVEVISEDAAVPTDGADQGATGAIGGPAATSERPQVTPLGPAGDPPIACIVPLAQDLGGIIEDAVVGGFDMDKPRNGDWIIQRGGMAREGDASLVARGLEDINERYSDCLGRYFVCENVEPTATGTGNPDCLANTLDWLDRQNQAENDVDIVAAVVTALNEIMGGNDFITVSPNPAPVNFETQIVFYLRPQSNLPDANAIEMIYRSGVFQALVSSDNPPSGLEAESNLDERLVQLQNALSQQSNLVSDRPRAELPAPSIIPLYMVGFLSAIFVLGLAIVAWSLKRIYDKLKELDQNSEERDEKIGNGITANSTGIQGLSEKIEQLPENVIRKLDDIMERVSPQRRPTWQDSDQLTDEGATSSGKLEYQPVERSRHSSYDSEQDIIEAYNEAIGGTRARIENFVEKFGPLVFNRSQAESRPHRGRIELKEARSEVGDYWLVGLDQKQYLVFPTDNFYQTLMGLTMGDGNQLRNRVDGVFEVRLPAPDFRVRRPAKAHYDRDGRCHIIEIGFVEIPADGPGR